MSVLILREKLKAKLNHVERFTGVQKGGCERKKRREAVRTEEGRVGKKTGEGRRERQEREYIICNCLQSLMDLS